MQLTITKKPLTLYSAYLIITLSNDQIVSCFIYSRFLQIILNKSSKKIKLSPHEYSTDIADCVLEKCDVIWIMARSFIIQAIIDN